MNKVLHSLVFKNWKKKTLLSVDNWEISSLKMKWKFHVIPKIVFSILNHLKNIYRSYTEILPQL